MAWLGPDAFFGSRLTDLYPHSLRTQSFCQR